MLQRFSNTLRFCWVLLSALLDSLTAWVRGLCQEHIDISTVLRIERSMLMQQAKQVGQHGRRSWNHLREPAVSFCPQGKVPTREAIHVYYQEQMMRSSRESGLDICSHDDEAPTDQHEEETPETDRDVDLDLEPVLEPAGLEEQTAKVLYPEDWEHREDGGDYPESPAATTSQKSRPRLSRMDRVESSSVSSSSDEEEGLRCPHWWVSFPPRR